MFLVWNSNVFLQEYQQINAMLCSIICFRGTLRDAQSTVVAFFQRRNKSHYVPASLMSGAIHSANFMSITLGLLLLSQLLSVRYMVQPVQPAIPKPGDIDD